MTILGPKPWVNPVGKMSIFRLFDLVVFITKKGVLTFQTIINDIFRVYIFVKKKVGKMAVFGGLTPLEKCQLFDSLNFLFFWPKKAFFRPRISQDTFSLSILRKQKTLKNWPVLDQNHALTSLEKCQFFDFLNFLFLQPRKAFFPSRIS